METASVIKPIRRGSQRKTLTWTGLLTITFLLLIALSASLVYFFPYDIYRPEVEALVTQATGRPVTIGAIRADIYPRLGVSLVDVQIGKEKEKLNISEVRLLPELGSLFGPKTTFRQVVLHGTSLPIETIQGLPAVFASLTSSSSRIRLKVVRFEKTEVNFAGLGIPEMEGDALLTADGLFQSIKLHSPESALSIEAKPVAEGLEVTLDGLGWRPAERSPFLVDSGNLKGIFKNGVFTIRNMELRIFDGLIKGMAVIRAETFPSISGEIEFERINATRFGEALGVGQLMAGDASGKIRFSALAETWAPIFSALNADGSFEISRGSLRGIDLPEAVRRVSQTPVQGGMTQFEQLSGKLRVTTSGYQISGLSLASGLMQSTGNVDIDKDLKLKGKLELQMRGTVNQMRVPVSLGGTLKAPEVRAGKY